MAEYIEREALKAAFCRRCNEAMDEEPCEPADCFARGVIMTLPAADVAPVRHGRWDDSGQYRFPGGSIAVRCTQCGCALTVSEYKLNRWNCCPVCGAKMDGGDEE